MTIEFRSFTGTESVDATDDGVIFGLAIPYSRETVIGDLAHGGFRENVAPGSCTKSIREADILALFNHNSSQPLGRTSAGNLTLKNTSRGVEPELTPVDTTYGRDLAELVRSRVIRGWSFGFEVLRDDWTDDDGNPSDELRGTNRTIREMKLREVSPCTFPAYEMTSISSRSALLERREALLDGDRAGNAPGNGKKPYGNVTYADPGYQKDKQQRYPIDTLKHVRAALAYLGKPKNAAKYTPAQLASIKSKISAAAKRLGVSTGDQKSGEEFDLDGYCPAHGFDDEPETRDEARAAKATYSDVDTCGDCGATGQYGQYCTGCGEPMTAPTQAGKYCAACGAKLSGDRDSHACETRDDDGDENGDTERKSKLRKSTLRRIPQISVSLNEALSLFADADQESLPQEAQEAIALIASAAEHAGHIMGKEGLQPAAANTRTAEPKPADDDATSADVPDDTALMDAVYAVISRDVASDETLLEHNTSGL